MKQINWFVCISFLLLSLTSQMLSATKAHNNLLPIESHDLTVTFHPGTKLLAVQDVMQINREKCKDYYTGSFILNKNAVLSSIQINGSGDVARNLIQFDSAYFNNEISDAQWQSLETCGTIYELQLPPYDGQEFITVTLKYQFLVDDKIVGIEMADNTSRLDGNDFWYPTFATDQVPYSLKFVGPRGYTVNVNGSTGATTLVETTLQETKFWIPQANGPIMVDITK